MIDISIGLGTGKMLAVLACDAHHHHRTPGALSLEHVHCIGVGVADSWTGETIAELLKRLIAQMGRPAAYLKDGGSELQKAVDLLGEHGLSQPVSRRYLARRGRHAQALSIKIIRAFETFSVGLWSGLGQAQAHDPGVFGAAQGADQSPLYECAPLVHLGRSGAQALASRRCQDGLDLSQVAGLPG